MKRQSIEKFIKNVLLLTATALVMRSVSLYFNVYLKNKLGTDGVGLFSLIMSVFTFAVTFATSGISLLATRLVSEAMGRGKPAEAKAAMKKCILYSLFFGLTGAFLLASLSPIIGKFLLGDKRSIKSLLALSVSLPFISLSNALSGYFSAVRRVVKSAAAQVAEQFLKISLTVMAFTFISPSGLENMCFFTVLGGVVSDIFSFFISLLFYIHDERKHNRASSRHIPKDINKRLLSIGLPIAFSSYFRSALVTVEHLLIPKGLLKKGLSKEAALACYGALEALALPIVMFPYAFLTPFCNLLVPEISEATAAKDEKSVIESAEKALSFVALFGIGTASVMLFFSDPLGKILCTSSLAAEYIRLLAPLVPIMYADTTVDSLLKGLDEQLYSMRVNIADSLLSVLLAFITVPLLGIKGYILNIVICELINFSLSSQRLFSRLPLKLSVSSVASPLTAGILSSLVLSVLLENIGYPEGKLTLAVQVICFVLLYLVLTKTLTKLFSKIKVKGKNKREIKCVQ